MPGQIVSVSVGSAGSRGATVIPREGVNSGPEGQYAYVVTADNKADQRLIKVLYDDGASASIDGDVQPGERVIVDGQLRVVPGVGRSTSRRSPRSEARSRAAKTPKGPAMNVSRRFIDYPVMTTLVMAALVIFGLVGYFTLPVNELPNVDFPTIGVSASLPGADPETMASAVAAPLENVFSTVARHRLDDVVERARATRTSRCSSARPQHRRGGAGRAGRDLRGAAPAAAPMHRSRRRSASRIRPTRRSCSSR